MVTSGSYYSSNSTAIYCTIIKVKSDTKVDVLFDKQQRSPNTGMKRDKTWLGKNSLTKVVDEASFVTEDDSNATESYPINNLDIEYHLELDASNNLDERKEVRQELKTKIRDLCKEFKQAGFTSNSLVMLAYLQVGMRELEI